MMPVSEERRKQLQQASRKHGIRAFENRGPDSLEPPQVARLQELRDKVRSQPGRDDLRVEMTARVALICELGFSELAYWNEAGGSIWESPVIRRAATWTAELRRLLDSFPPEQDFIDIGEVITKAVKESEKNGNT